MATMKDIEDKEEWLDIFLPIYEQAKSKISTITDFNILDNDLDAGRMTNNLNQVIFAASDLKFILDIYDELPEPKDKELRKVKKDFRDLLIACVSNGALWSEYIKAPGSRMKRHKITLFWSLAKGIEKKLSERITRLTNK